MINSKRELTIQLMIRKKIINKFLFINKKFIYFEM